ncbi:MAG: response regulator [Deinococcales bacterium]
MANVVVVDDEVALLRLVVAILERGGHVVKSFQRPQDALLYLSQERPNAIIADVGMPSMTGLEFCERVRQMPHLHTTPFLFLTALSDRPNMRAGMNAGADDYLIKPFTPQEILEALEVRLKRAALQQIAVAPNEQNVLSARALGGVQVTYRGQEIGWASKKAAEFFFYLLEHPNGVTTWESAEALWRDKDESRAASVFHTTLHRLRKTLGENVVYTKNRRYYLNPELEVAFDVLDYQNFVQQAEQAPSEVLYARAIELYGGAYMSGCDSSWCEDKREMLHATHLSLLLEASHFAVRQNDLRRAAWYAHLATQHEPYSDLAWTMLANHYEALGDAQRSERARARMHVWED